MSEKECPKCGGIMEAGKLRAYGGVVWAKGTWHYLSGGVRCVAYKCKRCGYIELYEKE